MCYYVLEVSWHCDSSSVIVFLGVEGENWQPLEFIFKVLVWSNTHASYRGLKRKGSLHMAEILPTLRGSVTGRLLFVPTIIPMGVKFLSIQKANTEHRYHSNPKLKGESRVSFVRGNKTLRCSLCRGVWPQL